MSINKQYRRDKATAWLSVSAGVQIECSHFDAKAPEYIAIMTKLTKPVRKLVEAGMLKPSEDRKYAVKAFVENNVKNWRTVDDEGNVVREGAIEIEEGQFTQFSTTAAEEAFIKYPTFFTDTVEMARELASFQLSDDEVKNSASA